MWLKPSDSFSVSATLLLLPVTILLLLPVTIHTGGGYILLYVALCTIMGISWLKEAVKWAIPYCYRITSVFFHGAYHHKHYCALHTFEQFGHCICTTSTNIRPARYSNAISAASNHQTRGVEAILGGCWGSVKYVNYIEVAHSPGFGLLTVAILPWLCRKRRMAIFTHLQFFIFKVKKL